MSQTSRKGISFGISKKIKASFLGYYLDDWLVIQSRGQFGNPIDYFVRDWIEYENGFGVIGIQTQTFAAFFSKSYLISGKEFWIGLHTIYNLTNEIDCMLRIRLETVDGDAVEYNYDTFRLKDKVTF